MRSLHIIGSKGPGGAERFYTRLLQALHRGGHEVLAVNPPDSHVARELGRNIRQQHVPMRSIMDLASHWQIRCAIRSFRPDIVQTWMGRATRLTRLRHGQRPVHVARLGSYYQLKGYRHAHAWVGITQGIHDYLVDSGLPAERVFNIGNFVPAVSPVAREILSGLRSSLGIEETGRVVVATGRLHPVKGFEDLLAAFSLLPETLAGQSLYLVIAGDGPLRDQLHAEASRLGIDKRVRWCGWQDEPGPFIELADVVICPSRNEPHGNVILEAWSHRRPLVSTDTKGGTELIEDGVNGLLVPCQDPRGLAAAMEALLQDARLRQQLVQAGLATIHRNFSEEQIVSAYTGMYAALAAGL
ncbi:MAG: glycosyltransferase [Thiohalobacterales bacterium]